MADTPQAPQSPNIEDWLHEKRVGDQSRAAAIKQSLAEQIGIALEEDGVSKAELARRMKTSRPAVDRLLDPGNQSVTLATLQKAAVALDRELQLELLGNWLNTSDDVGTELVVPTLLVRSPAVSSRAERSRIERLVGTVFFETSAAQIASLNEHEIVELLRRLIAADLTDAGVPLRSSTVPAQIHVPDGGEDGRVSWLGGSNETEYLPSRFCIVQAKAGDPEPAGLKTEVRGKATNDKPTLKPAVKELLERCGSYVVAIGVALTGQKIKNRKEAIREGIKEAGGEPTKFAAIEIYDANILSDWANIHPHVALWVNELQRKVHLSGFQSYSGWGKDDQIANQAFLDDDQNRFLLRDPESANDRQTSERAVTFDELTREVAGFLSAPRKALRIVGASGFGKSRLAYELFSLDPELIDRLDGRSVVFAQYEDIKTRLGTIALDLANSGATTILVVDDCPDDAHQDILAKAKRDGSSLRIVTTDVSLSARPSRDCRVVELVPASKRLIEKIVEQATTKVSQIDMNFVAELADGFPRMAVLGARAVDEGLSALNTIDDLVNRILWGRQAPDADALHLIEVLSLFALIGVDREAGQELESIASACLVNTQTFRNHLRHFESRGILVRKGDYIEVQLLPLAIRLGSDRISTLGLNGLLNLYRQVTPQLQLRLLRQLKWFDQIDEAREFGRSLLSQQLEDDKALNSEEGSRLLDRIMHVDPDYAMEMLHRLLGNKSINELQNFTSGRRYVVVALQKLVFREETFYRAATLLRRLGAAETENWSNNAAGAFEGLYKLYLSGTEAGLEARLVVMDEGLDSDDKSERALCVQALGSMLDRHHFSRGGGNEQIGSGPPMRDWQPKTAKDMLDFHLAGLHRLTGIACGGDSISEVAKSKIAGGIRGLLSIANFFDEIKQTIEKQTAANGFWPEAIMAVGDWLFYDSKGAPPKYSSEIRALYDELLKVDIVDQIIYYTKGWQTDVHDPDSRVSDDDDRDYEYTANQAIALAEQVANDESVLDNLLPHVTQLGLHGVFPFAKRLAECSQDPLGLVEESLKVVAERAPEEVEFRFLSGLVTGIDTNSHADAVRAIEILLTREDFGSGLVTIISGAKIDEKLLEKAAEFVDRSLVTPANAASLSYGRGLDHLDPQQISRFVDSLMAVGAEGTWAALQAVYMYQHGREGLSEVTAECFKKILIAPRLFEVKPRTALGTHELGQSVKLLIRHGFVDGEFARSLANQMIGLVSVEDYKVQLELDDAAQKVLELLIADHPKEVWSIIQQQLELEDALASHRVAGLLGLDKSAADGVPLLHGLPAEVYFDWMEEKPQERIAAVLGWLPITIEIDDGKLSWHPDLEKFVQKYVMAPEDLDIVGRRLYPSGWSGSLADKLEPYRELVSSWCNHPQATVRQWAMNTESGLRATILNERRQDANDNVRFFE